MEIYVNNDMERNLEVLKKRTEKRLENTRVLIGGGLKCKDGNKGKQIKGLSREEKIERERVKRYKDKRGGYIM